MWAGCNVVARKLIGNHFLCGNIVLVACGITCSRTGHSRTGGEADDIAACDGLDAYGNTLIFTAPGADGVWFTDDDVQSNYGANSIIYCGYRFDAETQNYYVRNRYYAPAIGRWIQRDPIGYAGGINLFRYAMDNPAAWIDAGGLSANNAAIAKLPIGSDLSRKQAQSLAGAGWVVLGKPQLVSGWTLSTSGEKRQNSSGLQTWQATYSRTYTVSLESKNPFCDRFTGENLYQLGTMTVIQTQVVGLSRQSNKVANLDENIAVADMTGIFALLAVLPLPGADLIGAAGTVVTAGVGLIVVYNQEPYGPVHAKLSGRSAFAAGPPTVTGTTPEPPPSK